MTVITGPYGTRLTKKTLKSRVGPGWGAIIERLVDDLFALGWDGHVSQVKEKWGGLRFYVGDASDEILTRIDQSEAESTQTCEICGTQDGVTIEASPYWLLARCAACR